MIITRVDLLRHGNCEGGQIYRGHTDSPLSERGAEQMQQAAVGNPASQAQWDMIYSSPLQRCQAFAHTLSHQLQKPLVVDQRLIEMDFGDWDGQSLESVWQSQQAAVMAFWQDPVAHPPPGAEPLSAMHGRVKDFLQELGCRDASSHLLLVTHGGVIRMMLAEVLGIDLHNMRQMSIDYGSLTRIELYSDEQNQGQVASEVIFSNRLPHISDYPG